LFGFQLLSKTWIRHCGLVNCEPAYVELKLEVSDVPGQPVVGAVL
jgi:hypothetical protein